MNGQPSGSVSIVIPHYNDVERLERCLEALMPQLDASTHVIVADNGSDRDLGFLTERWPALRLVHQPIKGAGPARNAGAELADTQWLAFLDADCVPGADWVATAQAIATENVVYGGEVTVFDESQPPRTGAEAFEAVFAFQVPQYLEKGFLPSCQLVMAKADFERVGGFRADVSEDVDWSRRATASGLRLALAPNLKIAHPSRGDWMALRKKWRRLTSEGFQTEAQSFSGRLKWALKAAAMPASAIAHAPRILQHPALSAREKMRGIGTLFRLRMLRTGWMLKQCAGGRL